jgi:hypothetical protein
LGGSPFLQSAVLLLDLGDPGLGTACRLVKSRHDGITEPREHVGFIDKAIRWGRWQHLREPLATVLLHEGSCPLDAIYAKTCEQVAVLFLGGVRHR